MNPKLKEFNHVDLLFPSNYLKCADLRGEPRTVRIIDIDPRHELKSQRGSDFKPAVTLEWPDGRKIEKLWVLNRTNANTIAAMYGNEAADWLGRLVTLIPARVPVGGKTSDAIRVKEGIPKEPAQEAAS